MLPTFIVKYKLPWFYKICNCFVDEHVSVSIVILTESTAKSAISKEGLKSLAASKGEKKTLSEC
jgi:hypothetical protein